LINKFDIFEATVYTSGADIIGVTESWATPNILDSELSLPGYQLFRSDRCTDNRGGGVLLYVRESLHPVEYSSAVDFKDNVWCQIGDLFVGVCYRSANVSIVGDQNNNKLVELLNVMRGKHTLIMGDFDYPEIDWSSRTVGASASSDCKSFLDGVEDCFYTQHVKAPTREHAVLDLVLTHEPDLVSEVSISDRLGTSDHNMLLFHLHHNTCVTPKKPVCRNYLKGDYDGIRSHLQSVDWDTYMQGTAADCWTVFKKLLLTLEDKICTTPDTAKC